MFVDLFRPRRTRPCVDKMGRLRITRLLGTLINIYLMFAGESFVYLPCCFRSFLSCWYVFALSRNLHTQMTCTRALDLAMQTKMVSQFALNLNCIWAVVLRYFTFNFYGDLCLFYQTIYLRHLASITSKVTKV